MHSKGTYITEISPGNDGLAVPAILQHYQNAGLWLLPWAPTAVHVSSHAAFHSLPGLPQAKAGKGKASAADMAGIPAVFQQMAGKIVDFPWDASTGAARCRLAVLCMSGLPAQCIMGSAHMAA